MSASAIILIAIAVLVSLLLASVGSILFYSLVRREQRSQRGIFLGPMRTAVAVLITAYILLLASGIVFCAVSSWSK